MRKITSLPYQKARERLADHRREIEADIFAINLMIDEEMLAREYKRLVPDALDLVDDPAIKKLAEKFRVSTQLMIIRLCQLGYFEPIVKRSV